jgi:hypothetical protein
MYTVLRIRPEVSRPEGQPKDDLIIVRTTANEHTINLTNGALGHDLVV